MSEWHFVRAAKIVIEKTQTENIKLNKLRICRGRAGVHLFLSQAMHIKTDDHDLYVGAGSYIVIVVCNTVLV